MGQLMPSVVGMVQVVQSTSPTLLDTSSLAHTTMVRCPGSWCVPHTMVRGTFMAAHHGATVGWREGSWAS